MTLDLKFGPAAHWRISRGPQIQIFNFCHYCPDFFYFWPIFGPKLWKSAKNGKNLGNRDENQKSRFVALWQILRWITGRNLKLLNSISLEKLDTILVIFQKTQFKEKWAYLGQNHQKSFWKIHVWYHLKLLKFDKSNWNEHIWWKSAQLRENCRKYLVFLVNFRHICKGKMYTECSDHQILMLNILRMLKYFQTL